MAEFDQAVAEIIKDEGGLVNNPNDPGGLTNHGISMRFLRSFGDKYDFNKSGMLDDDINHLTIDQAKMIYKQEFWKPCYEQIQNQRLCNFIFYMATNSGASNAHKTVQRAIWACDKRYYSSIIEDGVLGDKTIKIINELGIVLLPPVKSEYANFYKLIVMKNPKSQIFLNGWLRRCYES